ncbi:ABC transporter permease [Candidatus Falkowbacteria bacterium]|nr:ABC transporter permease [Candidatus Falkowbacteria bacterium]
MHLQQTFITSIQALNRNRGRSLLTMLGIVIGIASVIIVLSVGESAQNLILQQVRSIGSNLVVIFPGESEENGPPVSVLGINVTTLTQDDLDKLKERLPIISATTGYVRGTETILYNEESTQSTYMGVSSEYPLVEDTQVSAGRFFTQEEQESLSTVVVLGSELAQKLFNEQDAVGKRIKIKNTLFTVIGVLKERGPSGFENSDGYAFMPLDTAQKKMLGISHLTLARLKINDETLVASSLSEIEYLLRDLHDLDAGDANDFTVRTTADALSLLGTITNAIKFFLSAVAAISLIVGGVGIMNIMFVAITERTQEIGLRKALGAKQIDLIQQFLLESILLAIIGAIIGLFWGVALSYIISIVVVSLGYEWDFIITLNSILLAIGFAGVIGVLFGLSPALAASRLNPIESLRYE